MTNLDDPKALEIDNAGMFARVRELGTELIRAWELSEELVLPPGASDVNNVVVAGMGGSATGGDYFAALCAISSEVPVHVVRGYTLPNYVSERTLVVISSYSGDTEELLSCYDDAWKRGAQLIAATKGGKLGQRARGDGVPVYTITYESQPRAALAHSLAPLLRIGERLGFISLSTADVRAAGEEHRDLVEGEFVPEVVEAANPAKQLARALHGRLPLVLGAEHLASVASRFKNQVAENGKSLGGADILPEADHNLVVGLGTGKKAGESAALVTLEAPDTYDPRVQKRFDVTCQLFEEDGVPVHRLTVGGSSILSQLFQGTAWGDYVSCYLALLNGVDPSPVPQIVRLKAALAG
ncbi:MAG: bifunctional phosphoglucose/phosphomannose isomerase [Dehalococcoidia bacterium]|nr:bifunctional phosphoglucose/phosphomannose isomerase [Dehalococcoidia bacterium]